MFYFIYFFFTFWGYCVCQPCTSFTGGELQEADITNINNEGCTIIPGSVEIDAVVDDLTGLSNIVVIDGILSSVGIPQNIQSFVGLENLVKTNGLLIQNNFNIDFTALVSLSEINGDATFRNLGVANFTGLQNLKNITGNLEFITNPNLLSLEGLNNLENIGGDLTLGSENLADISALYKLTSVGGSIDIATTNINNFYGLYNINEFTGVLKIDRNSKLNCEDSCTLKIIYELQQTASSVSANDCDSVELTAIQTTCGSNNYQLFENETICLYNEPCLQCSSMDCVVENITFACGDGEIQTSGGEECDNSTSNVDNFNCAYGQMSCNYCNTNCLLNEGIASYCGDGEIQTSDGEQCDNSTNNVDAFNCVYGEISCTYCNTNCLLTAGNASYCGDGEIQTLDSEQCDNSTNNVDAFNCVYGEMSCNYCNTNCLLTSGNASYCGDGIIDVLEGEECDGATNCLTTCKLSITSNSISTTPTQTTETVSTTTTTIPTTISTTGLTSNSNISSNSNINSETKSSQNTNLGQVPYFCVERECNIFSEDLEIVVIEIEDLILNKPFILEPKQRIIVPTGNLTINSELKLNFNISQSFLPINVSSGCLDAKNGNLSIEVDFDENADLSEEQSLDIVSYSCLESKFNRVSITTSNDQICSISSEEIYSESKLRILTKLNNYGSSTCFNLASNQNNINIFFILLVFILVIM